MSYIHNGLGTPDFDVTLPQSGFDISGMISEAQQYAIRQLPNDFPAILYQAKKDYYTLKAGLAAGVVPASADTNTAIEWFADFPRLWEALRPNFVYDPQYNSGLMSAHTDATRQAADDFVGELGSDPVIAQRLGIAPLLIVGILVAGVAGVAGIIWALGYVKQQNNISSIIDKVAAGKLPPDVLEKAIDQAGQNTGPLADLGSILKWGAIAVVAVMVLPSVMSMFRGANAKS